MVDPVVSYIGVEEGDPISHKRFLALFAGGMLPLISLSFLHMLVKFEEKDKKNPKQITPEVDIDEVSIEAGKIEAEVVKEMESEKLNPTPEEIEALEKVLDQINKDKFSSLTENQELESEERKPNRLVYTNRNE